MKKIFGLLFMVFSSLASAQTTSGSRRDISLILDILGVKGVLLIIGSAVFIYTYVNSVRLFSWIDQQTYGTREYIL